MSVKNNVQQPCEACGSFAEIGTVIGEGDDVLELTLKSDNKAQLEALFAQYQSLAERICAEVKIEQQINEVEKVFVLQAKLEFTCTAEKIIFEMRARSIK